jgi:hypothetical protein
VEQKTEVAHLAGALALRGGRVCIRLAGLKNGEKSVDQIEGTEGGATSRIARLSWAAQWEEFAEKMDLRIIM